MTFDELNILFSIITGLFNSLQIVPQLHLYSLLCFQISKFLWLGSLVSYAFNVALHCSCVVMSYEGQYVFFSTWNWFLTSPNLNLIIYIYETKQFIFILILWINSQIIPVKKSMANKYDSVVNAHMEEAWNNVAANKMYMWASRHQGPYWRKKKKKKLKWHLN